jgi:hypothetical protein
MPMQNAGRSMNNKAPSGEQSPPLVAPRNRFHWLITTPWPIALLLFLATLLLDVPHNDFPYYYNFDEPTKTAQVLTGNRNFFHPPLLLNTTAAAVKILRIPANDQAVVVAGRTVSATFTAIAVAALGVLAFLMAGPLAALCAGALVMTHSMVFELSRFMKEDPALLAGLCLTFLAIKLFWDSVPRPGGRRVAALWFVAIASALALSGKYVGIAGLILAIITLALAPLGEGESRLRRFAVFLSIFAVTLLLLNIQLLTQLGSFLGGFDANVGDLSRERKWSDVPHLRRVTGLYKELVSWPVALLFLFQLGWQWRRDRRNVPGWLFALYPLIYTVILTFSPRLFSRHFLPIFVMIHFVAALGMVNAAKLIWRWRFPEIAAAVLSLGALIVILIEFHQPRLKKFHRCFSQPSREKLVSWMHSHLPAGAVLAQDKEVYLVDLQGSPRPDVRQKVITVKQLSDFGTMDAVRTAGVTHLIAHERWSGQFLKTGKVKKPKQGKVSKAPKPVREFYEDLKRESELVWKMPGGSSGYLAPGLQVYELQKAEPPAQP